MSWCSIRKRCLSELTEARCPRDDFAHPIRSDFVSAEPEKFTGDVMDVVYSQTQPHQLVAERHQTAPHQSAQGAAIARGRDRSLRARNSVDQRLNFFCGAFVAEKIQDDADSFFSDSVVYTGLCDQ